MRTTTRFTTTGLAFALGALCLLLEAAPARAGFIFDAGTGHYYGLTDTAENWNQAESEAVGLGGHLVSINSQEEQDFIVSAFLNASQGASFPLWIGLTDQAVEGNFVWTTGEAVAYTNWNIGEPNNVGGVENYAVIGWHFARGENAPRGTWNDAPLSGTSGFGGNTDGPYRGIIELDARAVPEPGSLVMLGLGAGVLGCLLRRRAAV